MSDLVFLNGAFVEAASARVSVFDRGFSFGDGVFETARVENQKVFAWAEHWQRFAQGLRVLRLTCPLSEAEARAAVAELLERNGIGSGFVRWAISRGAGPRGYGIQGASQPTLLITCGPLANVPADPPLRWTLASVSWQLPPPSPLTACKHANRLIQILAKADAQDSGADEPVLTGPDGAIAEAASGNIAWLKGREFVTPPAQEGALDGITLQTLMELARHMGLETREARLRPQELFETDGVLLTLSTYGVVEVTALDGKSLPRSPWTRKLWDALETHVRSETR